MDEMFPTCLSWFRLMLKTLLGWGCVLLICAHDHLPTPPWEKSVQAPLLKLLSSGSWDSLLEAFPGLEQLPESLTSQRGEHLHPLLAS